MTPALTVASLFSGIGLIDLGFRRAGIQTRLLCESDPAARTVLARHFPGVPIHPDVRELTADDLHAAGDPDTTILTAGFPCQDLSLAGARRGMDRESDTRSALYWEVDRLLDEFRPRWIVLENVPGLLSSRGGRDMGAVLGSLAHRGYGFSWRVLDAQHFGVAQRRRRVVIVGHLGVPWGAPAQVLLEPDSGSRDLAPSGKARAGTAGRSARRFGVPRIAGTLTAHHGRLDADSAAAGHFVVSQPSIGTLTASQGGPDASDAAAGHLVVCATGTRTHALTAEGHDASEDGTGRGTPVVAIAQNQRGEIALSRTMSALSTGGGKPGQGYPLIAATLTAGTSRPGVSAPGRRQEDDFNLVAFHLTQVRRLTPLECERLQGAPDGWTVGQSDSARYKQIGNSVAEPVFNWVASRLAEVDASIRGVRNGS